MFDTSYLQHICEHRANLSEIYRMVSYLLVTFIAKGIYIYIIYYIYIYIPNSHLFLLWLSNVPNWWLVWRQTKRSPRYVPASEFQITYRTALKNRRLTRRTQYLTRYLCCFCFRVFPIGRFSVCFGWPEKTSILSEKQNFGKPICGEAKVSLSDLPKCLQP